MDPSTHEKQSCPRRPWRIGLALVLLAGATFARGFQEQERWSAYLDGDVRYASQNLRVASLPDGTLRYERSLRALLDVFASQQQEILIQSSYVVTPDLRPVSMRFETRQLSGLATTVGQVDGNTLTVTLERAGATRERVHALDPSEAVLFSVTLEDWLARLDREGASLRIVNEETGDLDAWSATRLPGDAGGFRWQLERTGGYGRRTLTFDARGELLRDVTRAPNQTVLPCTQEEARDLTYRVIDGREALTFPLDRPIDLPHRLQRLSVRLTWRDIPFEEFELEDARQRVVERPGAKEGSTALVEITTPAPVAAPVAFPVEDAAFAGSLAETDFIKPADPGILAAAREATASAGDALEAVEALSKWVHGFIEGEMIAETLTGPEVLACGRGKCSEFSTLFASMARSLGIPTRLVLGERLVGNQWMGHMWNEAWVGRWVTVDTTVDEVDGSFLLLKFIHSDTVAGVEGLRWALVESLALSVEDFQLAESDLADLFETGIEGSTYTNVDYLARLAAPEGWTLKDSSQPGTVIVTLAPPDTTDVAINFVAFSVPAGTPPSSYIEARAASFRSQFESFEIVRSEATLVRDAPGHYCHSEGLTAQADAPVVITETGWVRGPIGYLLTMNARKPAHDVWHADVQALLTTFRFLQR